MGQNSALPVLSDEELEYFLPDDSPGEIPVFIRPGHPIQCLNLPGSCLSAFPLSLPSLTTLDLNCSDLSKLFSSDQIPDFPLLNQLSMSSCSLRELPSYFFQFPLIADINLDRNRLSEETYPFDRFQNLKKLDIVLNLFSAFPPLPDSLEFLDAGFNNIRVVNFILPNLLEFRAQGNGIAELSQNCSFPCLRIIDFSLNDIVHLPPISDFAPQLEELNLSYNCLTSWPTKLPVSLKKLNIQNNMISNWTESLEASGLREINASNNQLRSLPPLPHSLENIYVSGNPLTIDEVVQAPNLRGFIAEKCMFQEIPDFSGTKLLTGAFKSNTISTLLLDQLPTNVTKLSFSLNHLVTLEGSLENFHALRFLDLSCNNIQVFPDIFRGTNISSLNVSHNPIREIPLLPDSLTSFMAIGCQLTEINECVFNLPRLTQLDLSNNLISSIHQLPIINNLGLTHNRITALPPIPDGITCLDVSFNAIEQITFESDTIYLQLLDISHNKVSKFQVVQLPVLTDLFIAHNPLKMKIKFSTIPSIQRLDFTNTSISFSGSTPHSVIELTTSNGDWFKKHQCQYLRLYGTKKCGYSTTRGLRSKMEDCIIVRPDIVDGIGLYAVIDGHGGIKTALKSSELIPDLFIHSPDHAISAFSHILKNVNLALRSEGIRDGATIACAIISDRHIGHAHLGDSRAIIVKCDGSVHELTHDHRPTERWELSILKDNQTFVSDERTAGILAISRAIGDFVVEGLSRVPDIDVYDRVGTESRIVLACDGVFDVLSNEQVARIVIENPDPNEAAALVRLAAVAYGSHDNISVIVVDLEK